MKKLLIYLLAMFFSFGIVSCGEEEDKHITEKATNLQELYEKYDGVKFKDCDEMIQFGYEYIDVFVDLIDRAADGDEEALEELDEIDAFYSQFEEQEDFFIKECPEKYEEYMADIDEKMDAYLDKLIEIFIESMDFWEENLDFEDYDDFVEESEWINYEEEEF